MSRAENHSFSSSHPLNTKIYETSLFFVTSWQRSMVLKRSVPYAVVESHDRAQNVTTQNIIPDAKCNKLLLWGHFGWVTFLHFITFFWTTFGAQHVLGQLLHFRLVRAGNMTTTRNETMTKKNWILKKSNKNWNVIICLTI